MAGTHTTGEAVAIIRSQSALRQVDDSGWGINAANEAFALMWNAFPWDDSIKELPPFYLTSREAYHDAPYVEIPADFGQLHQVAINGIYDNCPHPLMIRKNLMPSLFVGDPTQIVWKPERPGFLIYPTPSEAWSSPEYHVVGQYKALPPQVTVDNIDSGLLPFADKHFPAFRAALLWAYYSYMGHPDAGQASWQDGRVVRSGQLARFYDLLAETTFYEHQGRGFDEIAPSEPLISGGYY